MLKVVLMLFRCVLLNWMHFLFNFILLPFFNKIILKYFMHIYYGILDWLPFRLVVTLDPLC